MASADAEAAILLQTLSGEVEAVSSFVDLLGREQLALSQGLTDGLSVFAEQKSALGTRLQILALQRNSWLAEQGYSADRIGIEAWCSEHPLASAIASVWATILEQAKEARELNRINGELIEIRMQHNARALETLRGKSGSLDLYGPDGQSMSSGSRRINDSV